MQITLIIPSKKETIPLAPLYLCSNLEKNGHEVDLRLIDTDTIKCCKFKPANINLFLDLLINSHRIVAIGCMNNLLPYILFAIKRFKQQYNKTIILGGPGPSEFALEIMKKFSEVDFIIKDRDPGILAELISYFETGKENEININGLVYKQGSRIVYNPSDDDYFDRLKFPENMEPNFEEINEFHLLTVEGCPYRCTFCNVRPFISRSLRRRNLQQVLDEIKWTLERIVRPIVFIIVDEAFLVNRKRVLDFCSMLKQNNMKIRWKCYGRINHTDNELMAIMKDAGCVGIFFGIESGSNSVLQKIKKEFTIEIAIKVLIEAKKYFEDTVASFIWGYPFESLDDLVKTVMTKAFLDNKSIKTQLKFLTPVRDSEIISEYGEQLTFNEEIPFLAETYNLMPESAEFKMFVGENKDIFLGYNTYVSPDLNKKIELLKKSGFI